MSRNFCSVLLAICLVAGLGLLLPQAARAWPTKFTSCTSCHTAQDADAAINVFLDGTAGTSITVAPGATFEVDFYFTDATDAVGGYGVGHEVALPAGWGIAPGTGTYAPSGWNAAWDNAAGVGAWSAMFDTSGEYPNSPDGYTLDFNGTGWDTGNRNSAFDDGSGGDLDGMAETMGADLVVSVPAGTADGVYELLVEAAGHDTGGTRAHAEKLITVTVASGGDTTPPTVSSTTPTNGATGVPLNSQVTINWDENVDCATVDATSITSDSPTWSLNSCSGATAIFDSAGQANSTTYNVNVTTAVTDVAGNPMSAAYGLSYTTAAPVNTAPDAPTNLAQYRSDGATPIAPGGTTTETTVVIEADLSDPDGGDTLQLEVDIDGNGTVDCSSAAGLANPSGNVQVSCSVADGSSYDWQVRTVDNGAANSGWTPFAGTPDFSVDATAPSVTTTVPAAAATGVAVDGQVTINFSEAIDCATVNTTNITSDSPGWALNTCSGSQAIFDTAGQADSTTYNVSVTSAVTDPAGNALSPAPYAFSYTTAGPVCTYSDPTVTIDTANQQITTDGGMAVYNVSVINNDSAACADTSFDLAASDSNGTDFLASTFGADPLLVAPGATANTTITVTHQPGQPNGSTNLTSFSTLTDANHGAVTSNSVTTLVNILRTPTLHYNVGETVHIEFRTATRFTNNGTGALSILDSAGGTVLSATDLLEVQSGTDWIYTYDWDTAAQSADSYQVQINGGATTVAMTTVVLDNPTAQIHLFADAAYTAPANVFADGDTVYVEVKLPSPETAIATDDISNWYGGAGFNPTNNVTRTGTTFRFNFVADFLAATVPDGDWGWFYWQGQDTGIEFHVPIQRNDAGCGSCTYATPTVSIVTGDQSIVSAGGSVGYTVNVTNNDSIACGSTAFDLSAVDSNTTEFAAAGSTFADDPLSVSPGTTGSTTMTVTAQAGFYNAVNNTYYFTAADANHVQSANSNTVTTTLAVPDTTAPTVAITAPADGSYLNAAAADPYSVTGTAGDDRTVSSVEVSIDSGPYVAATGTGPWSYSWTLPADGAHTIDARADDGTNTTNATRVSVTVDRTAPTTTDDVVAAWTTTDRTVTLAAGDATSGVASTLYCVDTTNSCAPGSPYGAAFAISQTAGQETLQYLRYYSTDNAGNTEATSSTQVRIDKKVPVDGATLTPTSGDTQVALSWDPASDGGSGLHSTASYRVFRQSGAAAPACGAGTEVGSGFTGTSTTDTGLTNGVQYSYRVCAYDNVGNVSTGLTTTATPAAACVRATPGVAVTANQDIISDGGSVDYTVTVTNNDTGGCAAQSFDVKVFNDTNAVDFAAPTFPAGSATAAIGPGGNDSTVVVRVTANAGTLNGATKAIDIATDGSADPNHVDSAAVTRTTTMNVPCTTAPVASITTTGQDITSDGGSVGYNIEVTNNNAVACGSRNFDLVVVDDNGTAFATPSVFGVDPLTVSAGGGTNTTTITVTAQAGASNGAVNNTYFYTGVNGTIPQSANSNVVTTTINRPCVRNAPGFSTGVNQTIAPDGSAEYALTVVNNDVDCGDSTFTFAIDSEVESTVGAFTLPSVFSAPSVTLPSGGTDGTVTLTVTGSGSGADGDTLTSTIRISDGVHIDQTTAPVTTIKPFNPLIHSSLSTGSSKHSGDGGWGIAGGRYGQFTCNTCHQRNSGNIKRVRATLPSAPDTAKGDFPGAGGAIAFQDAEDVNTPADFGSDDDAPRAGSSRVCEVCHSYDASQAVGVKQHAYDQQVDANHYDGEDCTKCHSHNSGFAAAGATCDSCHGYPPDPGDGFPYQAVEGKGAHVKHVNHLAALAGVTLDPGGDNFGDANVTLVCGACHDMNAATHQTSGGAAADRTINFNGSATFQFGTNPPVYNGVEDSPSSTTPKTCSNIDCHFQASPWWE